MIKDDIIIILIEGILKINQYTIEKTRELDYMHTIET